MPKTRGSAKERDDRRLLTGVEAAYHLGITPGLIYAYTRQGFGAEARRLSTVQREGGTYFDLAELDNFDRYLQLPWVADGAERPRVPAEIVAHLRAESGNQCLRCGEGKGVQTAHIVSWATSRSHHHGNLVRLCSACHAEYDQHESFDIVELRRIKKGGVARTKVRLARQLGLVESRFGPPPSDSKFVGRTKELEVLCAALEGKSAVLLHGPGGVGKTQLLSKALERRLSGGRVVWLHVEGCRTPEDIVTELTMSSADLDTGDRLERVVQALDTDGCCVVLDGVEQLAEAGLDDVDDLLADVRNRMRNAQLVVTSQVDLPRTGFDKKLALSGLDRESCRRLFRSLVRGSAQLDDTSESHLLDFADGHPLSLRLIAATVEHLGSGRSAVRQIRREGARSMEFPKRAKQNRETSLDRCLSLAYQNLSAEEQRLLFVIARCPGGLFAHQIEHFGGPDAAMLAAALRRWSLAERRDVGIGIDRWYALSPIRSFAAWRWCQENEAEAEVLANEMLHQFGAMACLISVNSESASDVPHMVWRFWLEWRNFLLVVDEADAHPSDGDLAQFAIGVCSSMVRFCFVARLANLGVRVMIRGARIAMRTENWESACGFIAEAASLAQRGDDDQLARAVEELLEEVPVEVGRSGNIAMAKAILANFRGNAIATEEEARKAIEQYEEKRDRLTRAGDGGEEESLAQISNSLSAAHQMLGHGLLAQSKPGEARVAYEAALELVDGASRAVNEGQILFQIGRCLTMSCEHQESADYYVRAAVHFQAVGMRDYLSNALGALGYASIELGESMDFPPSLSSEVFQDGIQDAVDSIQQSIAAQLQTGGADDGWAIRKLFFTVALLSLSGHTESLGAAGQAVIEWTNQVRNAGDAEKVARRAAFTIDDLEALAELMLSISRVEERVRHAGSVREGDVDELIEQCKSIRVQLGLESSVFNWLALYLRRRRPDSEAVEAVKS